MKLRSALIAATAVTIGATGLIGPASAAAPHLSCSAKVSNAHPHQRSNVSVLVHSASAVTVRTWAHYKTTTTAKVGKSNSAGNATIVYNIGGATRGYKVRVDVRVEKGGWTTGACTTYFTTA